MFAATRDIAVSDADAAELTDRFASMPPIPKFQRPYAGYVTTASVCSH
jgi:hypothetical protein